LRLARPSDDAVGAARLVRIQSALEGTAGYRDAISVTRADLQIAESTLESAGQLAQRANELALQGANGALTAEARQHIATEVHRIREQMISLANQKGTQGYLFSGTATDSAAFDDAGNFVGNDQERVVEIGANDVAVANISGAQAFTAAGGRDVFADLEALENALLANDPSVIAVSVNNADTCRRQILAARVDAGLRLSRLGTADAAHEQTELALAGQRSDVADADAAEAYSRFASLQHGLEQAIAVSRSVLSTVGRARFG